MRDGSTKIVTRTERLLGKGGQGSVYYANDQYGEEYAIKVHKRVENFKLELDLLLKEVKCVVKFFGHAAEPDKGTYYLLLEFCNSDLEKIL